MAGRTNRGSERARLEISSWPVSSAHGRWVVFILERLESAMFRSAMKWELMTTAVGTIRNEKR